ncbi:ABC1 family-domain-containing protein [Radiomyces spectabilis]|uniref:ABC1 family-domain-containing protein n=1 Tax=Radiomyces spectabilis TaxID=64574 RepID=UPI00221F2FFB|nr:ABC1 family-domain-containing protein [Radiomyces spectabilis]KAI8393653.1 ABC1 family-domain-containing protein [Radiomyces spectabilis]
MFRKVVRTSSKVLLGTTVLGVGAYGIDSRTEAQLLQRNVRTFYNGVAFALDYKLNFRPPRHAGDMDAFDALHERLANRMFDLFADNGGLYIKMGQAIGTQAAMLPPAYQKRARELFDSAPAVPFEVVQRVFMEDNNGLHPNEVFAEFDTKPIASASIAQVHKARLKNGDWVAVKIQKPAIQKQMNSDLAAFRIILKVYEKIFDLPLTWSADYIEKHTRMEADFESEARNAQKAWHFMQQETSLRDLVYIPRVYPEFSTKRVLVCEWVDGIQLTDRDKIKSAGLDSEAAMKIAIDAFASQIFKSGFVHGDPHPGNVLVRPNPKNKSKTQVVIIDHGLYIQESEKFRLEYCKLWEALFMLDMKTMNKICESWGIHDSNIFASITLQKPFSPNKAVHLGKQTLNAHDMYELQVNLKHRIKYFLQDQALFPRELIFISRNMNIVRANNKVLGSPVNRINVMARWAVRGLSVRNDPSTHEMAKLSITQWMRLHIRGTFHTILFDCSLFLMSLSFWIVKLRERAVSLWKGTASKGFEDILDDKLKEQIQRQFGVVVDDSIFDA